MKTGTSITKDTISIHADSVEMSAHNLYDEIVDAKLAFIKAQEKRWAYEFFRKDEAWYDETIRKVRQIQDALPKEIPHQEATIKMYGWITKNGKRNLSMPMMQDKAYPDYAHAITIEYILTRLNSYHSAMNWD